MSYVSVIEQVYDEFDAFVAANLPTVLAAYEAEQTDLALTVPAERLRGDYGVQNLRTFPGIIYKPGYIRINPDGDSRPLARDLLVFTFSIWVIVRGSSIDQIQRLCERYAWALKEVIDSTTYTPTSAQIAIVNSIRRVLGFDWKALDTESNGAMTGGCFVDVELQTQVNRV